MENTAYEPIGTWGDYTVKEPDKPEEDTEVEFVLMSDAGRLDFIKRVLEKRKEFYASMADFHEENGNEKYQTANLYAYHEVCTILRLLTTEDADEVYNAEHQFDKEF